MKPPEQKQQQRQLALALGRGGWLPFLAFLVFALVLPDSAWPVAGFKIWSALVLTFIGALRWGFALMGSGHRHDYLLGIVPSAVAAAALFMPALPALVVLGAAYLGLLALDWWATPPGMPAWFRKLRVQLTVGVVALHGAMIGILVL